MTIAPHAHHINPNTDLTVTTELESAGLISYWRCSEGMSLSTLTDRWIEEGLDPKLLPKNPEPETALRRAVMEQQDRHRLVRAVDRHTWAVVDEKVVEVPEGQPAQPPTYETHWIVRFDGGGPAIDGISEFGKATLMAFARNVNSAFSKQTGLLASTDVTSWLVKLAYKHGAVTLRDTGGVYFVPREHSDFWRAVARCVEATVGYRVFRIPAMRNSEAVAAIVDAVTVEAAQLITMMEVELAQTGDDALGKRAIAHRQAEAEAMLAKVVSYEKLLGMQLDVRSRVENLQANIVAAALT